MARKQQMGLSAQKIRQRFAWARQPWLDPFSQAIGALWLASIFVPKYVELQTLIHGLVFAVGCAWLLGLAVPASIWAWRSLRSGGHPLNVSGQ
jgi:hypothetical protein